VIPRAVRKTAGFLAVDARELRKRWSHQKTRCENDRKLAPSARSFLMG
jgi:hypothetical protein